MKKLTQEQIKITEQKLNTKAIECPTCHGHGIGEKEADGTSNRIVCLNCQGMGVIFPNPTDDDRTDIYADTFEAFYTETMSKW